MRHFYLLLALCLCLASCRGGGKSAPAALETPRPVPVDTASFFSVSPLPDSVFTLMQGRSFNDRCPVSREDLRYLTILHKDLKGRTLKGEMVCNELIAEDLRVIFLELYKAGYPIEKVSLIDNYGADDEASMRDDNSSCFNSRTIRGTSLISKHSLGLAVDINPFYNPSLKHGNVRPEGAEAYTDRNSDFPYKIVRGDPCHKAFTSRGFIWGGGWASSKDWQHFEKPLSR